MAEMPIRFHFRNAQTSFMFKGSKLSGQLLNSSQLHDDDVSEDFSTADDVTDEHHRTGFPRLS